VLRPVPLPQATLAFDGGFLAATEAAAAFAVLRTAIPWQQHRIRLFGRELAVPRLSCWIGDPDAHYRYSGSDFEPLPWPPALLPLRERVERACATAFNSVLANLYRDGRDAMGWHADDEPELGPAPVIASLSLGASRRFVLRHRRDPALRLALELPPGSLLVMRGATQANYRHALPRTAKAVGERINLTFRQVEATRRRRGR
jgi:alkylated DNA repair dioxygenase AlkB